MHKKITILVCGILPPPNFGHSMMYKMLMESSFVEAFDITFLDLKFWSYAKHKRVTIDKLWKMVKYWFQYVFAIFSRRPQYVLFNMSFDKMPFLKDYLFCATGALLGRRVVLHDMGQYLPELHNSSGKLLQFLIRDLLKRTYAIIVMGEKVRTEYAPFFDPKRIVVVPGVVEDTAGIQHGVIPAPAFAGVNSAGIQDNIEVLYFSYLSVTKGIWTALKAIPLVVQQDPRIRFTFAGPMESPQLQEQMEAFIKEKKLTDVVRYVGYVSDVPKRTAYFRNSDIFIFPTHRDVFGLVILHAMAEGVPVVASVEGTIPEILQDGTNGFLFEKGNEAQLAQKILALAADAGLRQKMGQANRRRYLENYTPDVYGRRMIRAFEQIMGPSTITGTIPE